MRHVNACFLFSSLILYAFHGVLDFKKCVKSNVIARDYCA